MEFRHVFSLFGNKLHLHNDMESVDNYIKVLSLFCPY